MQRNLLFLQQQQQQQQALARQAQQQRAAAAAIASGSNITTLADPMNTLWTPQQMEQQRIAQQPNALLQLQLQQQQLENENKIKQQKLQQQQQRLASMYNTQQKETTPSQPPPLAHRQSSTAFAQPAHVIAVKTKLEQNSLDLYVGRDQDYQRTLDMQHKRHLELAQSKKHEIDMANNERRIRSQSRGILTFGKGYDGYGNGKTSASSHGRVLFPAEKKRKRHHTAAVGLSYQHCLEQADKEEMLVPIRLDLENDGYKIRDTFTWNMNESSITPEQFADITCEDLRLPTIAFSSLISASIKEQIQEYFLNASSMISDDQDEKPNQLNAYDQFMKCKEQKTEMTPNSRHVKGNGRIELRTLIRLDIIVGNRILNDQFEWDITCEKNSPESFAETMATELGLGGEFK